MLKPLVERTLNINKKYLKEREHMKIQDREQTSIIQSLAAIETISAHESTPRPSLFKLFLDEITALIKKIPGPYIRQRKTNKTHTSEIRKQQMYINPP